MSEVTIRSNWLTVNGETLSASKTNNRGRLKVTPEEVTDVLIDNREIILTGIEVYYKKTVASHPGRRIVRPSLYATYLGPEHYENEILSDGGRRNGGVVDERNEFSPKSQAYFDAIKQAGFRPEARRIDGNAHGGLWMFLRRPTLSQVSADWLGDSYILPGFDPDTALSKRRDILARFQDERAAAIDLRDETLKGAEATTPERQFIRSRLQISTLLASAALMQSMEFGDPEERIDDALEYASNTESITPDILFAIANAESQ